MYTVKELQEQRAAKKAQMRTLINTAKAEKREFTDNESTQYDALKAEYDAFEAKIARAKSVEELEARETAIPSNKATGQPGPAGGEQRELKKIRKNFSIARAIRLRSEGRALDGIEKEMHEEAAKEVAERGQSLQGIGVPSIMVEKRADLVAGTDAAGGYTVETEVGGLLPILRPKMKVEQLGATVLTGLRGNINFPKQNAASVAVWEGETDDNAQSDAAFGVVGVSPKRLGMFTQFSKQLLAQGTISVENFVRMDLETGIKLAVDKAAINGSGASGEPTGLLNTSGIGDVAMGTNGGNPTRDVLVDLESAIAANDADDGTLAFLTTPGIRGKLRKTKTDTGSGLFVWGEQSNTLLGYNAAVSTQVPSNLTKGTETAAHAILFGDWRQLLLANWAGFDLVVDPYTLANKAMVKVVANSWWDIMVRYPKAFAAIKDATVS